MKSIEWRYKPSKRNKKYVIHDVVKKDPKDHATFEHTIHIQISYEACKSAL